MPEPAPSLWADLFARTSAAIVLIPVAILCIWFGGIYFSGLLLLVGLGVVREWCRLTRTQFPMLNFIVGTAAVLISAFIIYLPDIRWWLLILAALWLSDVLLNLRAGSRLGSGYWPILLVPYAALPIAALAIIRSDPVHGLGATIWIFLMVWSADTLAYFCGRFIGGPRLWPAVSPNKTWAGLAGAAAGSVIATLIILQFLQIGKTVPLFIIAFLVALTSQAGDLFESTAKRRFQVKDSGRLIPGHGGVLDRVDGLIPAAVLIGGIGLLGGGIEAPARGVLVW